MRVQLSVIPKTRVHFGESYEPGDYSAKAKKMFELDDTFHLRRNTLETNYRNGWISERKLNIGLKKLAKQEAACNNCLTNNFDTNMRPVVREVIKKENFFVRIFKALKSV